MLVGDVNLYHCMCAMSLSFPQAKSVQEKLAEAILKESQCSSEPELSDTSTEEEEETTVKGHKQDNEGTNLFIIIKMNI